jgi:hypothetical protein
MSTAEKQKPVKFKKVRIPVHFAGVNIGDETAAVGIKVNHEDLAPEHADAVLRAYTLLCCRRIRCILVLGRRGDGETQGKLYETDVQINGAFDTNNLSVSPKQVGSRLSCNLEEVSASDIAQFAKRDGYLTITSVMEEIDTGDDDEEEEADDE